MIINDNYLLKLSFQFNSKELFFTTSDEDLEKVGEYLQKNKSLIIDKIKYYDNETFKTLPTKKVRNLVQCNTHLDQQLILRNFY